AQRRLGAPLPGSLQVLPGARGRASADRVPLRGAQRPAGRVGGAGRALALVELVAAQLRDAGVASAAERLAGASPRRLGGMGERGANRGGAGGAAAVRAARAAVRGRGLGRAGGEGVGLGGHPAAPRPPEQAPGGRSTAKRFLPPFLSRRDPALAPPFSLPDRHCLVATQTLSLARRRSNSLLAPSSFFLSNLATSLSASLSSLRIAATKSCHFSRKLSHSGKENCSCSIMSTAMVRTTCRSF